MDLHRVLQEQRDWTATLIVNRPSVEMCRVESQWATLALFCYQVIQVALHRDTFRL